MDKEWVDFKISHARWIIQKARPQEGWIEPNFVDQWARAWEGKLRAYTLMVDGEPIACIGLALQEWGKAEAWALFAPDFKKYALTIYRLIKAGLKMVMDEGKIVRIQATIDPAWPENVKWIESLGFELEGRLRKYGPEPEHRDYLMYSMVA